MLSQARAQAVAGKLEEEGCENRFVVIAHADGHPEVGAQMLVRIVPRPDSDGGGDGVWPECDCEASVNGGGCHALVGGGGARFWHAVCGPTHLCGLMPTPAV